MKAIILCAGLGTRLRPLTFSTAKHLIPVGNKPVLHFGIESLVSVGARDIGMIVSRESWPIIQNAVDDGSRFGARIEYIEQPEPRGLAHACGCAEAFVGQDPFVMYLGDNLLPEGLGAPVDLFQRSGANAVVMLKPVDDPSSFGIAELDGDRIVRLVEKPKEPKSDLAIVGGYVFDHNIFESIRRIPPSWRNEFEITDAIQDLINRGLKVVPYVVPGWWKDTGKPADILEANRAVLDTYESRIEGRVDADSRLEGVVVIGPDAEVINSRIRGPVVIGATARLVDADIGPYTSIGDRVHVTDSRIENSVVMEESAILHVPRLVRDSLIGRRVQVGRRDPERGARLLLGDFCEVEIP